MTARGGEHLISRRVLLRSLPLATGGLLAAGCSMGKLVGGMAESYKRSSTRTVEPEYTGLDGRSFAVVIAAHRAVQTDFPRIVPDLTTSITQRLKENTGATAFIPAGRVLKFQYDNPRWIAMHPYELARALENVERLVYVDLQEFTLTDPGNAYLWNGVASGLVGVIESDSAIPEEYAFTKDVSVGFPDQSGHGPHDIDGSIVYAALAKRFLDRASWPFYEHEEPYYPDY